LNGAKHRKVNLNSHKPYNKQYVLETHVEGPLYKKVLPLCALYIAGNGRSEVFENACACTIEMSASLVVLFDIVPAVNIIHSE